MSVETAVFRNCCRSEDELVSRLLLRKPKHSRRKAGRHYFTYIDLLKQDTGPEEPDIKRAMLDRSVMRFITVRDVWT